MNNIEQTGDAGRPVSGVSISVGLVVRNLLFTVVVPGLGAVWMPWRILTRNGATPKPVSWFALAVIIVGAVLYFLCLWFFAAIGRGTPGPWDAPQRFVAVGPYRWVRNPIYIAALLVVIGEAWLFLSLPLLKYAVAMAVCFHLFVIGYEEPTLHRKFGDTYLKYKHVVGRWVPRRPHDTSDINSSSVPVGIPTSSVENRSQARAAKGQSGCVIVGGGPAGAMLALLLARRGVNAILLEMHHDFDREFRGDTVHPSTLEILDQIGLAERVHELRNSKISGPTLLTDRGLFMPFDLRRLKMKYPYILMVHQKDLLSLLTHEAKKYPDFQLLMGASVVDLIREEGEVRGVRYQNDDGIHELRALLTVGADGRFSRVRHLAGIEPVGTSPPMDVLWFRLPHLPEEIDVPGGAFGGFAHGHILAGFDRKDYWQVAFVIAKGSYQRLRAEGIEGLRRRIVEIEPRLAKNVESLMDWQQVSLLSVESSRCPRWYEPGLLLIGDAAHAMSPVGGVGINYAVQDAVIAANLLANPLLAGHVTTNQLRAVQRKREWPVRIIQAFQTQLQKRVIATALRWKEQRALHIPWFIRAVTRIPFLRDVPPRVMALGVAHVHVDD